MTLSSQISDLFINSLGITLVNSLWQGLLIALSLKILLHAIPESRVQLKYWLSVTALTAVIFLAGLTFSKEMLPIPEYGPTTEKGIVEAMATGHLQMSDFNNIALVKTNLDQWLLKLQPYMDTMVVIWMVGVLFFMIRLQGSMIYLNRLKVIGTRQAPHSWQKKVNELSDKLGLRTKVSILESTLAEIPMVIGHLKPVILLPVGMLTGLTAKEVEAILAHELAHIKRFDYLINIVQTVIESLLFFNPAVWWISQSIRKHREHCCDDIAVKYCGNQLEYANALSNLGAWSLKTPALGMGLFKNKNELLMRIKRLVYQQGAGSTLKEKLVPGIILFLTVLCLSWYSHRVQAQLVPTNTPPAPAISEVEQLDQVPVKDTIPSTPGTVDNKEVLPPTGLSQSDDFEVDEYLLDPEIALDIDIDVEELIDLSLQTIPDINVEELVDIAMYNLSDVSVEVDPKVYLELDELVDIDQLQEVMNDVYIITDDTTRERIRKALEAQRETMERARREQSEALEKAQKQLREALEAERPENLTDEEWAMAKRQIQQAERSLEQAMRQSERALERAMMEQNYGWHEQMERIARNNRGRQEMIHRRMERVEHDRERMHRDMARAKQNTVRSYRIERPVGKEVKLRRTLVEDGLIDNYNSDITLSFTRNQVKINGVKLEGEVKQKYRELLDEMYGKNSTGELEFRD